MEGDIDSFKLY